MSTPVPVSDLPLHLAVPDADLPEPGSPVPTHDAPDWFHKDIVSRDTIEKYGGSAGASLAGAVGLDEQKGREFGAGFAGGATDTVRGIADVIEHPIGAAEKAIEAVPGILEKGAHVIAHPIETGGRVVSAVENASARDVGGVAGGLAVGGAAGKAAAELGGFAKSLGPGKPRPALADIRPEPIKHHEIATEHAGLPKSDSLDTPKGHDLESQIRDVSTNRYNNLKNTQSTQGKKAFDHYWLTGEKIEEGGAYFTQSKPGIQLIEDLKKIEDGGRGPETAFSKAMRSHARKLREALSGVDPLGRKPVNLRVVDEELRALRAAQYDTGPQGFDAVKRERFGKLADRLEGAVQEWVGPENYPRAEYAQLSADLNKFGSKLGRELTERQDIEHVKSEESPYKTQQKLADKAFSSRETAAEFRSLVGDEQYTRLATRHVSNALRGKTAAQAITWLDDNAALVKEIPELESKANEYVRVMAEREGDAEALRKVKAWRESMLKGAVKGAALTAGGYGAYIVTRQALH